MCTMLSLKLYNLIDSFLGMFVSFVDITETFHDMESLLAPCWPQGLQM